MKFVWSVSTLSDCVTGKLLPVTQDTCLPYTALLASVVKQDLLPADVMHLCITLPVAASCKA